MSEEMPASELIIKTARPEVEKMARAICRFKGKDPDSTNGNDWVHWYMWTQEIDLAEFALEQARIIESEA